MENRYARARGEAERSPDFIDLIDTNFHACGFAFPARDLRDAAHRYFSRQDLRHYTPESAGGARLRARIADFYREDGGMAAADQVVVTASASESYSHIFASRCSAGDRILLPRPAYPLFEDVAARHGLHVDFYDQQAEKRWRIDLDQLTEAITPRTRGMVLITPNNPTGHVAEDSEIGRILELCSRNKLFIIVDEVFSGIVFEPARYTRPAALTSDVLIFTINGVSKLFASPDLKVSWILVTGPADECRSAVDELEIQNDLFLSSSPLAQYLAEHLFMSGSGFTESLRRAIGERRAIALGLLEEISALQVIPPEGGIHLPLLLNPGALRDGFDDEELAVQLLARHHVGVHPGYLYGFTEPSLVMSYLSPVSRLRAGIERIAGCLRELSPPAER